MLDINLKNETKKTKENFKSFFLNDNYGTDHVTASHYLKGVKYSTSNKITVLLPLFDWCQGKHVNESSSCEYLNKFPD